MHVVWFKRDLRISDHRPLVAAVRSQEPVCCLYNYEPDFWSQPDADSRHLQFINDCLAELQCELQRRQTKLILRSGDMLDVLTQLHAEQRIDVLHSHEETGNLWTYQRDKAVAAWCRTNSVRWIQQTQNGVIRPLKSRDGWAKQWEQRMQQPTVLAPKQIRCAKIADVGRLATDQELKLACTHVRSKIQVGGSSLGLSLLKSFLKDRGANYHREMSSPVTAWNSCSRLSAHLAWGSISMRQIRHRLIRHITELRRFSPEHKSQKLLAAKAYDERLHWHCHFIQKLEDQPDLEITNMHRACDNLRPTDPDARLLAAWQTGTTGYPLVDACMRSVIATGWLNFRMRAMLVSFASYHLWLDWRPTSRFLARMFTDYEPGIHYNQFQMQSGTTGISTVRIYNPIKQVTDQDPTGTFIRQWVPELSAVPDEYLAQPHQMPVAQQASTGCYIGKNYPAPIVDHQSAYAAAQKKMRIIRREQTARLEARGVFQKHGSRRGRMRGR